MYDINKFQREDLVTRASDFLVLNAYDQLWIALTEADLTKWVAITIEYVF
jgi:hypothetical protein